MEKKHKIQSLLVGLNIHTWEAYIKIENDVLNNWKEGWEQETEQSENKRV